MPGRKISRVHQMRGNFTVYRFFEILHREWFGDVVHRTEHQRLFDALEIFGACDHDDFHCGPDFARSGEDIKSIEPAATITNALAKMNSGPIKHLVNTHWHFDHT